VPGALADPRLRLFRGTAEILTNDDWSASAVAMSGLAAAAERVGAFALPPGSKDSAALPLLAADSYTIQVGEAGGAPGEVLAEVYDADADSAGSALRLDNLSARARVGTGSAVLVAGFTVAGPGEALLLLRALGPALARFGVSGTLADPKLEVFRGTTVIGANDNWGSQGVGQHPAVVEATTARVGAFALEPGARDAALMVVLPTGSYTVQVSGVDATTGIGLVELYEVP
jgi:hypothetical protein